MNKGFKETEIGLIPEDWEIKNVNDVAKINESSIKRNSKLEIIEYIDIASVDKGRIDNVKKLKLEEAPSRARRVVKDNDILISTVRPNLKHYAFINSSKPNTIASTGFAVISSKKIDPRFLYYYLTTDKYTEYLTVIAESHTSAYPSFNPDIIEKSLIPYPPKDEQKSIAKILADLDKKIHLNYQMNQTLEAIGQAIFQHWFINYEFPDEEGKPYKSNGGEMIDSEVGEIPAGWKVGELGDYIKFVKGKKPKEVVDYPLNGYLPQILIETLNGKQPVYANTNNMVLTDVYDPIMVMDGASSGRIEIGQVGVLGSTLSKLTVKERLSRFYVYFYLKQRERDINENTTGTSIPHADKDRIKRYQVHLAPRAISHKFDEISINLIDKIILNRLQNKYLSEIRNYLLPKLMSGKIRVIPEKEAVG
ncbi:MAG: restriction endonuclease subunit S [Methanobacteriaceae archaeon]